MIGPAPDKNPSVLARRWVGLLACVALVVIADLAAFELTETSGTNHLLSFKAPSVCDYEGCQVAAVGSFQALVVDWVVHDAKGRAWKTHYKEEVHILCERHGRCAMTERWPAGALDRVGFAVLSALVVWTVFASLYTEAVSHRGRRQAKLFGSLLALVGLVGYVVFLAFAGATERANRARARVETCANHLVNAAGLIERQRAWPSTLEKARKEHEAWVERHATWGEHHAEWTWLREPREPAPPKPVPDPSTELGAARAVATKLRATGMPQETLEREVREAASNVLRGLSSKTLSARGFSSDAPSETVDAVLNDFFGAR